ncbi:MAG: molybdopterin-guanine dinucleotide biosynthesis protein B [Candidatus Lokiarchaeota archaeon]|nr:molybdopterin-guanine dinucleotide biosynthesis protein B [Candidatus Lokiarchaeota archaeon]
MIIIQIIDVIGYSGSGKTSFIVSAIKSLKKNFSYNIVVIKNVKHHPIDKKGKDSYKFIEAGASYSVIQNINNETAIFVENKDLKFKSLLNWVKNGPYKVDIIFTEGFRDLYNPTVLCISELNEIEEQLTESVKIISGNICLGDLKRKEILNLPIIDIENEFLKFVNIFTLN